MDVNKTLTLSDQITGQTFFFLWSEIVEHPNGFIEILIHTGCINTKSASSHILDFLPVLNCPYSQNTLFLN